MSHTVTLIHHAASRGHAHPAGSLSALRACLEAGAAVVEVDIAPMRDGDFLLAHAARLEECSTGSGPIAAASYADVRDLTYLLPDGSRSQERLGSLSAALEMIASYPRLQELQLDLKPNAPFTAKHFSLLGRGLEPVLGRTRITTVADWYLWELVERLPGVQLGFDPLLYLDYLNLDPSGGPVPEPEGCPRAFGAFGYWDDHPRALARWGAVTDYLALRSMVLRRQVPPGLVWYVRGSALGKMLADGFNWIADLQAAGNRVAGWTLNPGDPRQAALARRLVEAGVDRITTDDPVGMAEALRGSGMVVD